MTSKDILSDLEHASRIARDGAETPLVGGPIGLMWGILLTATFGVHYLILERILAFPEWSFAILWISFAVLGGIGSMVLGRKVETRAGSSSLLNRTEKYLWIMFTAALGSIAVGVLLNQLLNAGSYELWTFVLIVGFAGQGLVYGVTAKLTGHSWLHFASLGGCIMAAVTMSFYGDTTIYLIAAIGTVITVIIPSLLSMKAAG